MSSIFGTPESQLVSAIEYGNLDKVKQLIAKNPNLVNGEITEHGDTALLRACSQKDLNIVSELINAGADVNLANKKDGDTPIISASLFGRQLKLITKLIKSGADVNAKNNEGETALMNASKGSGKEIVRALIQAGADVNARDNSGNTPLSIAEKALNRDELMYKEMASNAIIELKKAGAKSMKKKVFTGGRRHRTRTKKRKHVKRSKRKTRR